MTGRDREAGNRHPAYGSLSVPDRFRLDRLVGAGVRRRDMLRFLGGLGLSAGASLSILAAAKTARAQTPKRGGRLRVAHSAHGPGDTLDPILNTSTIDYLRGRMLFGSLVRLDDTLQPLPELATAFEPNHDATEWTFFLRKGVEFHDGKPFTADDVIYSMNRHLGPSSPSLARTMLGEVREWRKLDAHTVKVILDGANVDLPTVLGTFHFKIVQEGETGFVRPQGTGPFRLKTFIPGVRSIATAFENYWGEGPYVDEIEYFAIPEDIRRINALVTGEVDIIGDLPTHSARQVEAADNLEVWSVDSGAYYDIALRKDIAPGNKPDLILALKYLYDREGLVESLLDGNGHPGNDHPIGPTYVEHCADLPLREFDPDQALFHLKRAELADAQIQIKAAEVGPGIVDMCLLLQRQASRIGLNIEVQRVSAEGYWRRVWLQAPVCVAAWNMRPTANSMLSLAYHSEAAWNESRWQDPLFDQLLVSARGELDPAARRQMYCDMQEMIRTHAGTIIPLHRAYVGAHKSIVRGLTNSPLAPLGGCEWPEFVWLDQ